MKTRQIKRPIIEYYETCPKCKKEIRGTTESMVIHNLRIHKNSRDCRIRREEEKYE